MSDYTDIALHLENARKELEIVNKLVDDNLDFAYDSNIVAAQLYNGDIKFLMAKLDVIESQTNRFMDLIEDGINK